MSTPPLQQPRRSAGDGKKVTPPSTTIVTRNGARKAKIQTRAMSAGAKPSAALIAAKKKIQQKKKTQFNFELRDPYQIIMESKSKVKGPTGLVTEPRMAEHRCLWDDNYPECPERLIRVIERCKELNLIEQCKQYPPRAATKEELNVLHSPSVYEMLEATHQNQDIEYLEKLSSKYDAVYIHPSTHELALLSAGSTISMVERIVSGELASGAALVRPPGHHAMRAEPCGYCLYNNVALAAAHALRTHRLTRILIVDWDVHHGQATQQMFYNDPRVLYFSVHRYEHGSFWPNLRQSNFNYAGAGAGAGFTCNVPLNRTGMTDADYLAIWHNLLLPMAFEYQPQLIIISAGYDAAFGCPEFSPQLIIVSAGYDCALGDEKGEMLLTPSVFPRLLQLLQAVTTSICVVLEGGYCLPSLAEGAALTLRTLLGYAPPFKKTDSKHCDSIKETILNCIYVQRKYWNCFKHRHTYSAGAPNVCDGKRQKHIVEVKWEGDETRAESFATRDCYPLQDDKTKRMIEEKLQYLKSVTDLSIAPHAVGYVYDEVMLKHRNVCEPDHPECPERILHVHERLQDFGLLQRMERIPAKPATEEDILTIHSKEYLDRLKELSSTKLRDLHKEKEEYDSVYFHPDTLESAAMAAGCVLEGLRAVVSGRVSGCVCAVRPPGHHAGAGCARGFCLLNSAALAATTAAREGKRVLLLDWDVHHGDGTQAITYCTDQILYLSIHRYDHGSFFPNSKDADHTAVGKGKGEGFNVNIPWNKRGMGDTEYLAAFTQIVLPIAYEYSPDIVIVSCGFDACVGDPLGGCKVSPECFGRLTLLLRSVCAGRVLLVLEGGYNRVSSALAMAACTKALLGDPLPAPAPYLPIIPSAADSILDVISTHSKYWHCLDFHHPIPSDDVLPPPAPSRGLSLETPESLDLEMSNLSLSGKCADGIHCGTDDEKENKAKDCPIKEDSSDQPGCSNPSCSTDKPGTSAIKSSTSATKANEEASGSKTDIQRQEATTLVDYLAENMQAIVDGEMFAVIPLPWCPHVDGLAEIPEDVAFKHGTKCVDCNHVDENWVCLHCYVTACARGINGHMQHHFEATHHALVLSLTDLSVWCNVCDAYVDNQRLYKAKNNLHRNKFGCDMPWTYGDRHIQMAD